MSDVDTVMAQARASMDALGLRDWRLGSETNYSILGRTNQVERWIVLSREYILQNTDQENRDTVLHEIAHALVGVRYGPARAHTIDHGKQWVKIAKSIGLQGPKATLTMPLPVPVSWMDVRGNLTDEARSQVLYNNIMASFGMNPIDWYQS